MKCSLKKTRFCTYFHIDKIIIRVMYSLKCTKNFNKVLTFDPKAINCLSYIMA